MTPQQLQERTCEFALNTFRLCRPLLRDPETRHVAQQLIRAATSVASNYRAACLGRSRAEFRAKLGLVREEADESRFWLDFMVRAGLTVGRESQPLTGEARQLAAIFFAAYRTSRRAKRPRAATSRVTSTK